MLLVFFLIRGSGHQHEYIQNTCLLFDRGCRAVKKNPTKNQNALEWICASFQGQAWGGRRLRRRNKSKLLMYSRAVHSCLRYLLAAFALHFSPGGWYWSAQRWVILHASNLKGATWCPFSDLYLSPQTPAEPLRGEKQKEKKIPNNSEVNSVLTASYQKC